MTPPTSSVRVNAQKVNRREILKQKFKLTDDQLREKMHEVDMRDGALDGKNQRKAVECPTCGHMVSSRHPACLYCGQIIDSSLFSIG